MALTRDRIHRIFTLAIPIIGGMISQNILNLVDTAMVGVLGDEALAAVGLGGFANFLLGAFFLGLSSSVQATASRRVGEGRLDRAAEPLNGGLLIAIGIALPWSLVVAFFSNELFGLLVSDPQVVSSGGPYLQARLLAMVGMSMNFSFRGFWNATDRPGLYMRALIVMHITNITLNYLLIFGAYGFPRLGATGAGVASAIATYIGTAYYFILGFRHGRENGFLRVRPSHRSVATLLRLTVPAGLQQFFFAAGMTAFFWIVGKVGTAELAAANVLINLTLVGILPGLGFGLASATLVGQALGRKEPDDASRWAWDVSLVSATSVLILALPGAFAPDFLLELFLPIRFADELLANGPAAISTLELARLPLQIVALSLSLDTVSMVMMSSLIGAGDNRRVMYTTLVLQWGVFLPLAYLLGPVLGHGLLILWLSQVGYRLAQGVVFVVLWTRGSWRVIKI
ncbi:MAG: MATE family efflux transporter [Myxococcales bacterium]|nr:MATE family efflux transporter [Myxococcales bacterium]